MFEAKKKEETAQEMPVAASIPPRPVASTDTMNAILGKGSEFEGKLTFEGTVRIDGRFKGQVFSKGKLIIGADAQMKAEVDAGEVVISGEVEGNLSASKRLELRNPGRLRGNISSPRLMIEEGVFFEGSCKMGGEATKTATAIRSEVSQPVSSSAPRPSAMAAQPR